MSSEEFVTGTVPSEGIRRVFSYDPRTGKFIRLCGRGAGKRADYLTASGYRFVKYKGTSYVAHRLAWFIKTGKAAYDCAARKLHGEFWRS